MSHASRRIRTWTPNSMNKIDMFNLYWLEFVGRCVKTPRIFNSCFAFSASVYYLCAHLKFVAGVYFVSVLMVGTYDLIQEKYRIKIAMQRSVRETLQMGWFICLAKQISIIRSVGFKQRHKFASFWRKMVAAISRPQLHESIFRSNHDK